MKTKFFPFFITAIFLLVFFIFYRGLQNSNIYTPNLDLEKKIPSLVFKSFDTNSDIISENIFHKNKFYLMNMVGFRSL